MTTLWHYTCAHGDLAIGPRGILLPALWQIHEVPMGLPTDAYALLGLVWATDMDAPDRQALGLTSATLSCDRMAHRYAVPAEAFTPWGRIRHRMSTALVDALELANGAQPAHWWAAEGPVSGALRDATYLGE